MSRKNDRDFNTKEKYGTYNTTLALRLLSSDLLADFEDLNGFCVIWVAKVCVSVCPPDMPSTSPPPSVEPLEFGTNVLPLRCVFDWRTGLTVASRTGLELRGRGESGEKDSMTEWRVLLCRD